MPALALVHLVLGAFLLAFVRADTRTRANMNSLCGCIGAVAGLWLVLAGRASEQWRTTELLPAPAAIAGAAVGCAWLLVAVLSTATRLRPEDGALVAVGSSAAVLFASTRWIVPSLLFWLVLSTAAYCSTFRRRQASAFWPIVALGDAAFVGGLVWWALDSGSWELSGAISGAPRWLLVGAAVLRVGTLPRLGTWSLIGTTPSIVTPLVTGSGFLVIAAIVPGSAVGVGLGLLLAAIGWALWGVLRSRAGIDRIAAWPPAVLLATALVAPQASGQAGIAALVAVTAVCLWPFARGRAQVERGLILSLVPATAGFGAVTAAAVAAFAASNASPTVARSMPWSAVAALLPVAVACGVALGTRLGRVPEPESYAPYAVIATWVLFGLSLLLGILPPGAFGPGSVPVGRSTALGIVAIVLGAAAMRIDRGLAVPSSPSERRLEIAPLQPRGATARASYVLSLALLIATSGAVLWLTYRGLSVGFL